MIAAFVFVVVASPAAAAVAAGVADDVTPRVAAALRNLYRSVAPPTPLLADAVALITCCSENMASQRERVGEHSPECESASA